ncbi:hypothetical protein ACSTEF_22475, partial [Vibrio vulnificus]
FFLLECDSKLTHYHPNWLNFNSDNYPARGGLIPTNTPPSSNVSCSNCKACCCRLEVMIISDTGVPEEFIARDQYGG